MTVTVSLPDLNDPNAELNYGAEAQAKIADFSEMILQNSEREQTEDVSYKITTLITQLKNTAFDGFDFYHLGSAGERNPDGSGKTEGGLIVGKQLKDGEKIVIIEDVMTSGKALREVLPKLKAEANVDVSSMVIQVDRMERGLTSELSAVEEVKRDFGVNVYPIVTILDIIAAAESGLIKGKEYVPAMLEYRAQYGTK